MPAFVPIIAGIASAISSAMIVNEGAEYFSGESIVDRMELPNWSAGEEIPMKVALFAAEYLSFAGEKTAQFIRTLIDKLGIINSLKRAVASFFQTLANPAVGSYVVAVFAVLFSLIAVWGRLKSGAM